MSLDDTACVSVDSGRRPSCTWLQVEGLGPGDGNFYLYVVSLYWALSTITTVGFGDIVPNTAKEMLYATFVMVLGVTWYAVLISTVGKVFTSLDTKASEKAARAKAINSFVHKHRIGAALAAAMHQHLRRRFEVDHGWRDDDHDAGKLVRSLSKPLRRLLALHLERKLIAKVPLFDGRPRPFVADAVLALRSLLAAAGEVVLARGYIATAVHLVVSGEVAVRVSTAPGARRLGRLRGGTYFGDEGCLLNARWCAVLCGAAAATEIQLLPRENLLPLLEAWPEVASDLRAVAADRVRKCAFLTTDDAPDGSGAAVPWLRPPPPQSGPGAVLLRGLDDGAVAPGEPAARAQRLRKALRARAIGVATPDAALAAAAHYAFAEHLAAEGCADARDLSAGGRTALLEELVGLVEDGGCKLGLHF